MKYIDADKLIAEIERHQQNIDEISAKHGGKNSFRMGRQAEVNSFRQLIDSLQHEQPEVFDTMAFQKGVQEGRRLEREDVKSIIQSRIDEILGDAQPNPILRMELHELIKKIEV